MLAALSIISGNAPSKEDLASIGYSEDEIKKLRRSAEERKLIVQKCVYIVAKAILGVDEIAGEKGEDSGIYHDLRLSETIIRYPVRRGFQYELIAKGGDIIRTVSSEEEVKVVREALIDHELWIYIGEGRFDRL